MVPSSSLSSSTPIRSNGAADTAPSPPPSSSPSSRMRHRGGNNANRKNGNIRTAARSNGNSKNHHHHYHTSNERSIVGDEIRDDAADENGPTRTTRRSRWHVASWCAIGCAVAVALLHQPHLLVPTSFFLTNLMDRVAHLADGPAGSGGGSQHYHDDVGSGVVNPDLLEDPNDLERRTIDPERPGKLRPRDLPGPTLFDGFDASGTVRIVADDSLQGRSSTSEANEATLQVPYRQGQVLQINRLGSSSSQPPVFSTVTHLPQLVPREVVHKLRALLREHSDELDEDPDTVDGMPTYEVFVDSVDLRQKAPTNKVRDDPHRGDERRNRLRRELQQLTEPYAERMALIVRAIHPDLCNVTLENGERRLCTPCYSLIRRYRHGERKSHPPHYDGHARVTVVVSLSEYSNDYTGGLYVATGHGPQREFFNLTMGDAVLHPSTLLHGVHVYPSQSRPPSHTERYSWIVWFRDSETCVDHSMDWFHECALQGNPLCQQFQASKVVHQHTEQEKQHQPNQQPSLDPIEASRRIMELNTKAAHGGAAEAAVKVARAYLKQLPSALEFSVDEARRYFQIAMDSHSSEGHYGMAQILVAEASAYSDKKDLNQQQAKLKEAVAHLESAALSMHAFASFNLGIAHIYGYGVPRVNMERGVEWLVQSGLPEGLFLASQYAATIGDQARHDRWLRQAHILGWDQPWRVEARKHTGSGGAAGVDLNLMWPPSVARDGIQPPEL